MDDQFLRYACGTSSAPQPGPGGRSQGGSVCRARGPDRKPAHSRQRPWPNPRRVCSKLSHCPCGRIPPRQHRCVSSVSLAPSCVEPLKPRPTVTNGTAALGQPRHARHRQGTQLSRIWPSPNVILRHKSIVHGNIVPSTLDNARTWIRKVHVRAPIVGSAIPPRQNWSVDLAHRSTRL